MKDKYGRNIIYLRWSITENCNLQCYYCTLRNENNSSDYLSLEEIDRLSKVFKELGFEHIRLTGGEPTVREDIVNIVKILSGRFSTVSMTTNGTLLLDLASKLKNAGLSDVNISLDSLKAEKFLKITGKNRLKDVINGIQESKRVGLKVKLNTVLLKENKDDLLNLIEFAMSEKVPIRFIELMPFGNVKKEDFVSQEDAMKIISEKFKLFKIKNRFGVGPSNYYKVVSNGKEGIIGFISAITHKFCDSCNKIRISSKAEVFPCLAYPNLKVSLRDVLYDENKIKFRIEKSIRMKPLAHNFDYKNEIRFSMRSIGG